jgi:hypothetical protein
MKHIKIANQSQDCHRCSSPISTGEFYFTKYLSGGRYMSEKPDYRLHIRCVTKDDLCCEDGGHELLEHLGEREE